MPYGSVFYPDSAMHAVLYNHATIKAALTDADGRVWLYTMEGMPGDYRPPESADDNDWTGECVLAMCDGGSFAQTVPLAPLTHQVRCYASHAYKAQELAMQVAHQMNDYGPVDVSYTGSGGGSLTVRCGKSWVASGLRYMKEPELGWHCYIFTLLVQWLRILVP